MGLTINNNYVSQNHIVENRMDISRYTNNHVVIKDTFEILMNSLDPRKARVKERVFEAVLFAAEKHQFQSRKDVEKTPYIIHPIGVALSILVEAKMESAELLIIALLHDTMEDTDTTHLEIQNQFGGAVADAVKELSDEVGSIPGEKIYDQATRKRLEIEHAGKLSIAATVVKLSDKLYNLRDLQRHPPAGWDAAKKITYAKFAESILRNIQGHHSDKMHAPEYPGMLKLEQLLEVEIENVKQSS